MKQIEFAIVQLKLVRISWVSVISVIASGHQLYCTYRHENDMVWAPRGIWGLPINRANLFMADSSFAIFISILRQEEVEPNICHIECNWVVPNICHIECNPNPKVYKLEVTEERPVCLPRVLPVSYEYWYTSSILIAISTLYSEVLFSIDPRKSFELPSISV